MSDIIATARTVQEFLDNRAVRAALEQSAGSPRRAAPILALLGRIRVSIERAQERVGPNVMVTPSSGDDASRESSLLLSMLSDAVGGRLTTRPLPGAREAHFETDDWSRWATRALELLEPPRLHPMIRPPVRIDGFPDRARVAILGDWGTNLYGAPVSARTIEDAPHRWDMLLHLGDIYYSGTREEVRARFLERWPWQRRPGAIHRTLNGNHEMYSGGWGYFQRALPALRQDSSYFALSNRSWLLIGLDTAYVDHDLDESQLRWLKAVLEAPEARGKRVILFSHHPLFSRLDGQGWKLAASLNDLLRDSRIWAWYWGHEHRCCLYERHPLAGFLGRCVGHGGMPVTRSKAQELPVARTVQTRGEPVDWRRFTGTEERRGEATLIVPPGLVLDGCNRYIPGEEDSYAPHGFAVLSFDGPALVERILSRRERAARAKNITTQGMSP